MFQQKPLRAERFMLSQDNEPFMRQHVHHDLKETSIYGEHDGSIVIGVMADDLPHMSEEDFYMAIIGVRKALKKLEN